jgi:hypothetical protein
MGKRSRRQQPEDKIGAAAGQVPKRSLRERFDVASARMEREIDSRPRAPWDPFPLAELAIFVGMVTLLTGLFVRGGTGAGIAIAGFVLILLGTLETMMREHFAGFRSHAGMLAGLVSSVILGLSVLLLDVGLAVRAIIVIGVFAIVFPALRRDFHRRAGERG